MVYITILALIMLDNNETNFLTVAEVSDLLRLSELTIYKYIRLGMLDASEFGGHYRISKTSLDLFIENHKVKNQKEVSSYAKALDDKENEE